MITSYTTMYYILNLGHKVYNQMRKETLMLIHIGRANEVFHDKVILFTWAATQLTPLNLGNSKMVI